MELQLNYYKKSSFFVFLFIFTSFLTHFTTSSSNYNTIIMDQHSTNSPRSVTKLMTAHQQREGGGFIVRRPIGGEISEHDPFLLLDHFGPKHNAPGEAIGAPDHPHRGFETVTYLISGSMQHKDSAGNSGTLADGWVQWMTAGSGVVHSEMPSDNIIKNGGTVEGFQLWVNLPAKDKMIPPRYQDTPPERIPVVATDDGKVTIKVIAGEALNTKANIDTRTPILYLDIHLQKGSKFTQNVPANYEGFVYIWRGSGYLGDERKPAEMGQIGILGSGDNFTLEADSRSDDGMNVLLIAGVPIKEPVVRSGPFVMNTWEEIQQAYADYQSGKLGSIEGAKERYAATEAARNKQRAAGTWKDDL